MPKWFSLRHAVNTTYLIIVRKVCDIYIDLQIEIYSTELHIIIHIVIIIIIIIIIIIYAFC